MDPQSTLDELETATRTRDFPTAVERLATYYQWRLRGGFAPIGGDKRAEQAAADLSDAIEGGHKAPPLIAAALSFASYVDAAEPAELVALSRVLVQMSTSTDYTRGVNVIAREFAKALAAIRI